MRVSIVDPSAYTPPYDHAICSALAGAGTDVELVTSRFLYGSAPLPRGYEVREHFYRRSSDRYADNPASRGKLIVKLAEHPLDMVRFLRHVSTEKPEIVHFQWAPVQPLDKHFFRRIKQPVVITAHDVVPREPRLGQLRSLKRLYRSADALIAHTRHGADRLRREVGIDGEKIHVIPHGAFDYLKTQEEAKPIDRSLGDLEGRKIALFFGLIRPYKGVDLLIEAFKYTSDDAVLLVVGMPKMSIDSLKSRVESLNLQERIRFLPRFVSDPEIPAYFNRADLVVLPYREIDQSGVLYTALAFHKPMILTDVGGFSEFASETGAARLVPSNDAELLGIAIAELLQSPDKRKELAEAAAKAAAGTYSWDRIAEQTLELYRSLLR